MAERIMTIADMWVNRLDEHSSPAITTKMQDDAVAVVEERGEYVYIFKDGSAVYEKRRGDWYPAGEYVQCPECEEWRAMPEGDCCDICDDCDAIGEAEDEQAAAILKSAILN
jgi:hypothetical protein